MFPGPLSDIPGTLCNYLKFDSEEEYKRMKYEKTLNESH